ncbi:hypothetical protein Q0O09_04190, partial [Corynebacterium bovis]|nr:hypothetical protein [Corynebacterium bovis]
MSTLTPLVVDPDGVRRAVALARDVAAALVPGATAAPVAGPVPVAGRAPVAGPVPVAARAPVAGPVPVAARAPLAGPAPVAGPVPDATLHAVTALLAVPLPHAARLADALTSAADLHARTAAGLGAFYSGAADALAATAAGVTATDSDAAHVLAGLAGAVGAVGAGGAAGAVPPGLTVPSDLSLPPGLSVPPGLPFPPGGGAGPGGAGAVPSAEELTRRVDAALPGALASAAVPRLDDAALRVRRAIDAGAQLADLARQALAAVAGAGADIAGIVRAGVEEAAAGTLRAAAGSPTVPALAAAALTAGLTGTSARVDARLAALDDTLADLFTRTDDAVAGLPGVPPPPGRHADPAAGTPAPAPADT